MEVPAQVKLVLLLQLLKQALIRRRRRDYYYYYCDNKSGAVVQGGAAALTNSDLIQFIRPLCRRALQQRSDCCDNRPLTNHYYAVVNPADTSSRRLNSSSSSSSSSPAPRGNTITATHRQGRRRPATKRLVVVGSVRPQSTMSARSRKLTCREQFNTPTLAAVPETTPRRRPLQLQIAAKRGTAATAGRPGVRASQCNGGNGALIKAAEAATTKETSNCPHKVSVPAHVILVSDNQELIFIYSSLVILSIVTYAHRGKSLTEHYMSSRVYSQGSHRSCLESWKSPGI